MTGGRQDTDPTIRLGRADLHIHTWASDGTAPVQAVLDRVETEGVLDVIAITDHERIDAAVAAREMALDQGLRVQVVVGEEISTRGGHLLALFLDRPVPPMKSLRWSIEAVHDQGGLAIPAHPLVPFPMCAQGGVIRRLLDDDNTSVHPDALETWNPTALGKYGHGAAIRFAEEVGLPALGNSDAHALGAIGTCWTTFPGRTEADVRTAIETGLTAAHGAFHGSFEQLGVYRGQLAKYARGWRATALGAIRRDGTGRDLGYPGGTRRPPAFDQQTARRLHAERRGDAGSR